MDHVEIDLRAIERGTVTAPAGCGKTQLIAHALAGHRGNKPILVLTHTNAGVAALRGRLDRAGVRLGLLDPTLVLQRGYAWLATPQGQALTSVSQMRTGQDVRATLADGSVELTVR